MESIKSYRKLNMLIFYLSLLIFSLSLPVFASAKVNITDVEFQPTISEFEYINITFTAVSNTSNVSYEIYKGGVLVAQNNSYTEKTDYSYEGIYDYTLVAFDNESSSLVNITIEVLNVPMMLEIKNPEDKEYFDSNISIVVSINQYAETTCSYSVSDNDGVLMQQNHPNSSNITVTGQLFAGSVILEDGDHVVNIACENEFDSASDGTSFKVFANPVSISSLSYTIDQSNGLHVTAETEYDAECRYSLQEENFESMDIFSATNALLHTVKINGLTEGIHKIYVACKSHNGLVSYDSLNAMISTRPTATISIDKPSPLRQGIYAITLKTSKEVQNSPSLYYVFNNENTQRTISLTGSGFVWKGYLIIEEDTGNKVGTFRFSGTDFNGLTGNIITDGEIFLVDTVKPLQVTDIKAELEEDQISVSWFYDDEDFENFKVYRSEGDSVNKNDYLKSIDSTEFIDDDIVPGETYTYMVVAQDEAGNEGPLSDEVQIEVPLDFFGGTGYVDENTGEIVPQERYLDSQLYGLVDEKISELEVMLLDIESMQEKLDEITDVTSLRIIVLLELDSKIKNSKSSIESILSQLKDLKKQDLTQSDLEIRLNKLKLDAIKAQSAVMEELIIEEKGSFEQMTQESDVESAVMHMIDGINVSKPQLKDYIANNKRLQDQVIVKTESISFKIRNLNQENYDRRTLIYKTIRSSGELKNISMIEIIPKEVENTASDISYIKVSEPEIIKDDPVVKWDYDSFESAELYYIVDDSVPLTSLKNIRTIILEKPDFKMGDDKITGMLSFENVALSNLSPVHWIIVIGVGLIIVLGAYYFVVLEKQDSERIKRHQIINYGAANSQVNKPIAVSRSNQNQNSRAMNIQNVVAQKRDADKRLSANRFSADYVKNYVKKKSYPDYAQKNDALDDKLPEVMFRKIEYCNSVINMMDYERARSLYNETVSALPGISDTSDVAARKLSHVKAKLDAYRHIHNARRHLYYKRLEHFSATIKSLNECYGQIAHNIGFMPHIDNGSEVKFLSFVAENVKQLEKNRDMMLKR